MATADRDHPGRELVLVAGSGRSGTSLLGLILRELGYRVPQPEVEADPSNPRGFAESRWVVDLHTELLRAAGVHPSDARPVAWLRTGEVARSDAVVERLREWLDGAFAESDRLVVKDPRLAWFLPLWRAGVAGSDAHVAIVTMLRHPAEVADSKLRWYTGRQPATSRVCAWINVMLYTERATRGDRRAFVHFTDLLDDWTVPIARIGDRLDLARIGERGSPAMRRVHGLLDPGLRGAPVDWSDLDVAPRVRDLADRVWGLLSPLDVADDAEPKVATALDEARADYLRLYEEAEAIAHSTVLGVRRSAAAAATSAAAREAPVVPDRPGPARQALAALAARVPPGVRRWVPARQRRWLARVLGSDQP